jgi:aminomethyltransferase
MADASEAPLRVTPLNAAHRALGAKMVPFAGYDMPVQYPTGVLTEHVWTRENAGLFDVSHMGQALIVAADGRHETVARALETLIPADAISLAPGQQRYSQLLNDAGGILDDLMFTRPLDPALEGTLMLVVNAANKTADYAHIAAHLPAGVRLEPIEDRALLALQGPRAVDVLAPLMPAAAALSFMTAVSGRLADRFDVHVSRSGYTGEDGFEISVLATEAVAVWELLIAHDLVKPIGLGARDSLRLEAGLCLHGHDIDAATSPVEANLSWSIQKRRREEGGFPGFIRLRSEWKEGASRLRVGLKPEGRAPAREGAEIVVDGRVIGTVTSGGFGPTVNGPVAMGYVERAFAAPGTQVDLMVRGKPLVAHVVPLPFVPARFMRKKTS